MTGDPSRRPSNDRVLLPSIDAVIWIECRSCFGDGWHHQRVGPPRYKITCTSCAGRGRYQIPILERDPRDVVVGPPRGWHASSDGGQ